jgi:hypothetical protein
MTLNRDGLLRHRRSQHRAGALLPALLAATHLVYLLLGLLDRLLR